MLEEIDSPFVCNLRFAFQDDENLFMVLDLMLGGDLRFHLDRLGAMKEDWVRFYVAEMALALGDLHKRGIVHRCVPFGDRPDSPPLLKGSLTLFASRDIKPDNILLDEKGHAHLTDFNIAVHFTERRPLTSVAGSMAYMGTLACAGGVLLVPPRSKAADRCRDSVPQLPRFSPNVAISRPSIGGRSVSWRTSSCSASGRIEARPTRL